MACAAPVAIIFLVTMFGSSYHYQQTHPNRTISPRHRECGHSLRCCCFSAARRVARFLADSSVFQAHCSVESRRDWTVRKIHLRNSKPHLFRIRETHSRIYHWTGDIVIPLSWLKSLLLLVFSCLFAGIAYSALRSGQNTALNWIAACLFGLGIPLMLISLFISQPLLRFSIEGIAYKGASFFLRGQVDWEDVQAIILEPAPERQTMFGLLGRYNLRLIVGGNWLLFVRFLSWQLPSSTQRSFREVMIRYHEQIEENEIVVRGIE